MIVIQSVQGRHARRTTVVSVSSYCRWYASRFRRFSSTRSLASSGSPAGGAHRPPPPDRRPRPLPFGDPLVPQLPLPGRDPRQLAAVEPRAAASRATIDRDSGPSRLDQPSRTARTLHRCFLSRIIASSGSTYSAGGGHGRSADRQVPPGSAARTLLPVRARGVPRRPSRVPPGPATSRDTGRRRPRRHRRVSVRGATGRIADSPCSGPLPGRAHQIKRPLVAIHHEGSRSEGLIPLGEAGSP